MSNCRMLLGICSILLMQLPLSFWCLVFQGKDDEAESLRDRSQGIWERLGSTTSEVTSWFGHLFQEFG